MKTVNANNIELATSLLNTIELRKELEKKEKELKDQVRLIMGENKFMEAGEVIILLDERERTDLDKKTLKLDFGAELIEKYEKTSTFIVMNVRTK